MKLVVGLGNPGKKYENTRHNIGFMCVDYYARLKKIDFKEKFNGLYAKDKDIILLKPQSFMNLSGSVVSKYISYYKIKKEDVLIIYDDADFNIGEFKIKPTGSSGGHNGIKDIINHLGTEDIKRVRVGVSKKGYLKNYVLSKFNRNQTILINEIIEIIGNVINDFNRLIFDNLMNKYNK